MELWTPEFWVFVLKNGRALVTAILAGLLAGIAMVFVRKEQRRQKKRTQKVIKMRRPGFSGSRRTQRNLKIDRQPTSSIRHCLKVFYNVILALFNVCSSKALYYLQGCPNMGENYSADSAMEMGMSSSSEEGLLLTNTPVPIISNSKQTTAISTPTTSSPITEAKVFTTSPRAGGGRPAHKKKAKKAGFACGHGQNSHQNLQSRRLSKRERKRDNDKDRERQKERGIGDLISIVPSKRSSSKASSGKASSKQVKALSLSPSGAISKSSLSTTTKSTKLSHSHPSDSSSSSSSSSFAAVSLSHIDAISPKARGNLSPGDQLLSGILADTTTTSKSFSAGDFESKVSGSDSSSVLHIREKSRKGHSSGHSGLTPQDPAPSKIEQRLLERMGWEDLGKEEPLSQTEIQAWRTKWSDFNSAKRSTIRKIVGLSPNAPLEQVIQKLIMLEKNRDSFEF